MTLATTTVTDLLERAQLAYKTAVEDLAAARAKVAETQSLFDGDRSKHRRASLNDAKTDMESAERVHQKSEATLEEAKQRVAKWEHEQRRAELLALEQAMNAWQASLDDAAAKFVELDKQVAAIVNEVASSTKLSADRWARADLLAGQVGQNVRFRFEHAKPTLAEGRLRIQRMITAARLEAGRPAFGPLWLASADLREAAWSASELANVRPHVAKVREAEKTAEIFNAGVIAGANAVAETPEPTSTETPQ